MGKVPGEGDGETQSRFSCSPPVRRRQGARDPQASLPVPGRREPTHHLSQILATSALWAASALPVLWGPGRAVGGDAAVTDPTPHPLPSLPVGADTATRWERRASK